MNIYPSRLFALSCRPDPGPEVGGEAVRLAGAVRDWDVALGKAEREGIAPLLYWALRDDPCAVPSSVLKSLRLAFLGSLARATRIYRELEIFLESLRRSELRAALTKR